VVVLVEANCRPMAQRVATVLAAPTQQPPTLLVPLPKDSARYSTIPTFDMLNAHLVAIMSEELPPSLTVTLPSDKPLHHFQAEHESFLRRPNASPLSAGQKDAGDTRDGYGVKLFDGGELYAGDFVHDMMDHIDSLDVTSHSESLAATAAADAADATAADAAAADAAAADATAADAAAADAAAADAAAADAAAADAAAADAAAADAAAADAAGSADSSVYVTQDGRPTAAQRHSSAVAAAAAAVPHYCSLPHAFTIPKIYTSITNDHASSSIPPRGSLVAAGCTTPPS
jgi:hypothetical protein